MLYILLRFGSPFGMEYSIKKIEYIFVISDCHHGKKGEWALYEIEIPFEFNFTKET
jgi:hypothetical protein